MPVARPSFLPAAETRACSRWLTSRRWEVPSKWYPIFDTSSASESPAFHELTSARAWLTATTVTVDPAVHAGERARISACI